MIDAVWLRVAEDERATDQRIRDLHAEIAEQERHREEIRLFSTMLAAYTGDPEALGGPSSVPGETTWDGDMQLPSELDEANVGNLTDEERQAVKNEIFGWESASTGPTELVPRKAGGWGLG